MTLRASAIIPNKNGAGLVGRCVAAARTAGAAEVIVVDDGSTDASPAEAEAAGATVVPSAGRGFAQAVNTGAARAGGDALLILNSDCFLAPDAIAAMTGALAADPRIAVAAAALTETDGTPSKSDFPGATPWLAIRTALSLTPVIPRHTGAGVEDVDAVPLACALVRRTAWDELGGLDERFFFYFEDHDLCRRLHASGWRIVVAWQARATHLVGGSSRQRDEQRWFLQFARSRAIYLRKHFPLGWLVFSVIWVPVALVKAAAWSTRRTPDARRWAGTWLRAAWFGVRG